MNKERCLVVKAMEKCQCEMCRLHRDMRKVALNVYVQQEIREVIMKSIGKEKK